MLVARFPAQTAAIDLFLTTYLNGLDLSGDAGIVIGQQAAAAIIALRNGDGSFPIGYPDVVGGTGPGEWRPTLPAFLPMAAPWLGAVAPFTLKSSDQLSASPPPPHLASGEYARDYDEVKALGRATLSARTQAQTDLQRFSDMAQDVVDVRVYQGIHFRTADEVARRQGTRSADWAFSHVLRSIQ